MATEHEHGRLSVGALEFHMLDSLREAGRRAAIEALESAPAALLE